MNRVAQTKFIPVMSQKEDSNMKVERPLIILPTYNEADNITLILDAIESLSIPISILVVDDSSPDGTAEKVIQHPFYGRNIFLIRRPIKSGLGSAYKEGFKWGLKKGHDVCVEMDSDFSHDPKDIPRLLKAIEEGADIANGSRYLDGISIINWPLHRLMLSLGAGMYVRFITGMSLSDPTTGFKAIRSKVLEQLQNWEMKTEGYGIQIETNFFASRDGYTIKEIPIIFTERRNGQSKLTLSVKIKTAIRVLQLGFGKIWGK